MATIPVELPDDVVGWIETEIIASGEFSTVAEYLAALIAEDRHRDTDDFTDEELNAIMDDGEASGISPLTPEQIFEQVRQKHRRSA